MGDACDYVHVYQYEDKRIPKDVLMCLVHENKRRNYLTEIAEYYPNVAKKFDEIGTSPNAL